MFSQATGSPLHTSCAREPLVLRMLPEVMEKGAFQLILYGGLVREGRTRGLTSLPKKEFVSLEVFC